MQLRIRVLAPVTVLVGALAACGATSLQDGVYHCGLIRDTSEDHMVATDPAIEALVEGSAVSAVALGGITDGTKVPFDGLLRSGGSRFKARLDLTSTGGSFSGAEEYDPSGTGTYWVLCSL
jgi:hypothetical protein